MFEIEVKHPIGRFRRCRCGKDPKHVRSTGRSSREPMITIEEARAQQSSVRHRIECSCGAVTARHPTLEAAEAQWGSDYAQLALPLVTKLRRKA